MKKTILSIFVFCATTSVFAQNNKSDAGTLHFPSVPITTNDFKMDFSSLFYSNVEYACDVASYKNEKDCINKAQKNYDQCVFVKSKCYTSGDPNTPKDNLWICDITTKNCTNSIPCVDKHCCIKNYLFNNTKAGGYCYYTIESSSSGTQQ